MPPRTPSSHNRILLRDTQISANDPFKHFDFYNLVLDHIKTKR